MTDYPNNENIAVLENKDFSSDGKLLINESKPVLIMLFGNSCPHCVHAKPEFSKAARKGGALFAVIPTDGPFVDSALLKRIPKFIPNVKGIPTFVLFRNGRYIKTHEGARTEEGFRKFINS
jgi:thiol-disulfide isomerase/thioredoxin